MFADPNHIVIENYLFEGEHEQRYRAIGMSRDPALVVVFVERSEPETEIIHIISVKISGPARELYKKRDGSRSLRCASVTTCAVGQGRHRKVLSAAQIADLVSDR